MDKQEWKQIVAKLNSSYPGQELRPETAVEWFTELAGYPAERVWRGVRRCRRERDWMPNGVAVILDAMLANAREQAAEPSTQPAIEARDPDSPGVPPPAAYRAARERFLSGTRLPEEPAGRSRAQQLADLEAMMAASDAAEAGS